MVAHWLNRMSFGSWSFKMTRLPDDAALASFVLGIMMMA
jgi:hypothetical protein